MTIIFFLKTLTKNTNKFNERENFLFLDQILPLLLKNKNNSHSKKYLFYNRIFSFYEVQTLTIPINKIKLICQLSSVHKILII
jgi:hypothetical protein